MGSGEGSEVEADGGRSTVLNKREFYNETIDAIDKVGEALAKMEIRTPGEIYTLYGIYARALSVMKQEVIHHAAWNGVL